MDTRKTDETKPEKEHKPYVQEPQKIQKPQDNSVDFLYSTNPSEEILQHAADYVTIHIGNKTKDDINPNKRPTYTLEEIFICTSALEATTDLFVKDLTKF